MDGQDIPSPLPFVISILPLLLSVSDVTLPASTLSSSVLQRHYYLSSSSESPSSYLQATADESVQQAVESRREALASTWLEDVKPSEIQYSAAIHEEQKLVARITLSTTSIAAQPGSSDSKSLVLLVVYEEASPPDNSESGSSGNPIAGPSSQAANQASEEESGWKYYDLQLPHSKSNLNSSVWHNSVSAAKAALARLIPSTTTDTTRHNRSASVSSAKKTESAAQKALREKQREADAAKGLSVEEGPEQDPDDYWAGCESSDDEGGNKRNSHETGIEEEDEDNYWNNYAQQSPGIDDNAVDSDNQKSEKPQDEDYTMRYNHDTSESIGHFEYSHSHHPDAESGQQHADYSFESEAGQEQEISRGGRMLVEETDLRGTRANDSFLTTLQSSLERVSSSQTPSSQSDTNGVDHEHHDDHMGHPNGHMNGNGHANPDRPPSPTIDSAISKSIAGLWETYLLSSALGGGGKSREIAAYEFMELVQAVVQGDILH